MDNMDKAERILWHMAAAASIGGIFAGIIGALLGCAIVGVVHATVADWP